MNKLEIEEFHIPFIKSLVFVGLVTIVSMISVRLLLNNYLPTIIHTESFASEKSHDKQNR